MKSKLQSSSSVSAVADKSGAASPSNNRCEELLDSREAAGLLRIHPKTLQRMARQGQIPAIHIGKLWRFSPSALLLWQQESSRDKEELTLIPQFHRGE